MKLRHLLRCAGLACAALLLVPPLAAAAKKPKPEIPAPPPEPPPLPCEAAAPVAASTPNKLIRDCADTPEMVLIPSGAFKMGDTLGNGYDYERPVHTVSVKGFFLGRYEVTVRQWNTCVAEGGCSHETRTMDTDETHPIANVSWDEAMQFTVWLSRKTHKSYRLPSEAEWEYAARAGSEDQYTWGNMEAAICLHANIFDISGRRANPTWGWSVGCDDGFEKAAPVGSFPPNAWGLYDMIGNVWEWVADCWHVNYDGAPTDGSAWMSESCPKHVNRGAGWGNHARTARIPSRDADVHGAHSDGLGFRVARDIAASDGINIPPPPALPAPAAPAPTGPTAPGSSAAPAPAAAAPPAPAQTPAAPAAPN